MLFNDLKTDFRSDRGNREYHQLLQHAKLELKKSKRKDYYKILGVERGASDEEIKRAYRKRALVHHPGQLQLLEFLSLSLVYLESHFTV